MAIRLDKIIAKDAENDVKIGRLEAKVKLLETENAEQDKEITHLKKTIDDQLGKPGDVSTSATEPSSCKELATNGYSINGLYLVKNPDTRKIEAVSCSFGTSSRPTGEFI